MSITGPQPIVGANGTQPPVNGGQPGSGCYVNGGGVSGSNGNGQAPRVTNLTQPNGGGYVLPDDEDLL